VGQYPAPGRVAALGRASMEYIVVLEQDDSGWGAYVPDLPGCVAVGRTRDEVQQLIREAIPAHIAVTRAAGEAVPPPGTWTFAVAVQDAAVEHAG
jgi:predicted RNase H-like HicB family nuclease